MSGKTIQRLLDSKKRLIGRLEIPCAIKKSEEEGGCGVVGFCCTEPVPGRHIYEPSRLMHNRGNGKGGGVAAAGFIPEQLGVSREVLNDYYMIHIAFLDAKARSELEAKYIKPVFDVEISTELDTVDDWSSVKGLEVRPPDVCRYFVRVKPDVVDSFIAENSLEGLDRREAEDEFVNQNSFKLNQEFYASLGDQKAFVLSHGRNIMILKVVGYAEAIVQYYRIEELRAHAWIAHQRFPTKGRVWHPGGAHPFAGINMALVHNGDFANYHSVSEYLLQRHIYPQFLTDTEVSALMFDLLNRTYHYPLEYIIEALAPTTELDFDHLPEDKQDIYRTIQSTHMHGSPDGPWFFIILRNIPEENTLQLLGITDTAMLRPQVFAFSEGEVQVGLICSEKQAIDATLLSLSKDDTRICPVADRYWNARGGSYEDGGSFIFNLSSDSKGKIRMTCTDKFGLPVRMPDQTEACDFSISIGPSSRLSADLDEQIKSSIEIGEGSAVFEYVRSKISSWGFDDLRTAVRAIADQAKDAKNTGKAINALVLLNDLKYPIAKKKRSHVLHIIRDGLNRVFNSLPRFDGENSAQTTYRLIDYQTRDRLRPPIDNETTLVINSDHFPPEGDKCDAVLLVDGYYMGWREFIMYNCTGQRYVGCGLGPETDGVTIDVFGSSGDYLGSGLDGLTINVHNNAQDQLGQIMKSGKLVVFGDAGQTFMYGAKGGEAYVMGNAAGRPLINSVGRPKIVINGTCLDFLAESFMAGDPHNGGGFVILNGIMLDDEGRIIPLPEPYPGSNLFSLASGGAIFLRDPHKKSVDGQLNGGMFLSLTEEDWNLIRPYLEENERLFGIKIDTLLTVDGELLGPNEVYRKVVPAKVGEAMLKKTPSLNGQGMEMETVGDLL
ncbi:MAG: glutamate synthase [Thermodesulfobacteriota bacterium]|nr:glutamate synthase [Thermodesulfobacteriota bacterium]